MSERVGEREREFTYVRLREREIVGDANLMKFFPCSKLNNLCCLLANARSTHAKQQHTLCS